MKHEIKSINGSDWRFKYRGWVITLGMIHVDACKRTVMLRSAVKEKNQKRSIMRIVDRYEDGVKT